MTRDGDDRDWPDPPGVGEERGQNWARLRFRLACSAVVAVLLVGLFWGYITGFLLEALWPPQEPLTRWATLVLLQIGGFLVLPLLVGGLVGDALYDRLH
jgi:asparagine N-glycosylation enzyme membrane subunit Stt3